LACFALLCHFHIALLAAGTFIALLSKETTLLALPALMALCVFRREALGRYRMGSAVAVLALLGAFAIALRIPALGSFLPEDPLTGDQSLAARLARLGVQLTLLSGIDLRALQQVPGEGARLPMIAVALGVAVAAATLFGRLLEQRHLIGAALVAMAGLLLLPTALARLPALRYLHAPLAIASVLLAGALAGLARHWRPRAPYVVGLAFLLPWCALNQLRLPAWTNDARLFATEAALAPGNPDALYFEGSQLMTQGRAADAQKRFAAALELAPNHRPSWLGLTQALLATGRAFAAEDTIRQSLRGEPQTYPQFQLLGDALAQQGNHLAALEAYKQALALAPDARTALLRAARSAQALGRLDEAQRLRKQAGQLE
jgi:tetratricopeptide (TPR) repeat protein